MQVWRDPMTSRIPVGHSYTSSGALVVYLSREPPNISTYFIQNSRLDGESA